MTSEHDIDASAESKLDAIQTHRLYLGLFEDFGISTETLENTELDDAIEIDVMNGDGRLAGANVRSVLFAVYRYLEEIGCRWIRPGQDGDFVPVGLLQPQTVKVKESAAYRHRGICIEGAVSLENMKDHIEWAPKVGFNAYFLEFKTPYTFFERWYNHRHNAYKEPEGLTITKVQEFKAELEIEIAKRGLLYHAVGHGWTGEPLGLPCLGWEPVCVEPDERTASLLAQVQGQRKLWHGVPLNSNLCYSNAEARRLMVKDAADYAQQNPQIAMLHVWLADAPNNHCECEACSRARPADFYVRLLNELDEELIARQLETRIVFLLYLDLLWTPETEKLRNPGRFLLLFAPVSRTYSRTYDPDTTGIQLPPYERNRLKFPQGIRENVAFLKEWQKHFDGDSFAYEYHFMWDHYFDPGYEHIADIISADVKQLRHLGLNGMVSDQTQRSFFPSGLGMYVLGKTLWNENADFDALSKAYYEAAFGADAEACQWYLRKLSTLFDPPYMRGEKPRYSREAVSRLAQVRGVVHEFQPCIEKNLKRNTDPCRRKSWAYLGEHAELVVLLADAFQARADGRIAEARQHWERTVDWARQAEDRIQPVFDVFLFIQTLQKEFEEGIRTNFGGEVS
ncbi:DUF4838 domain-containing protein [Paenibacillus roseipurpureus]|uniref:DUF4838 domain-containing protein n=1 Tax=Paenibacillus roseopurpureus TaxID=2918901 RepID=A0AA96LRT2_9BACL|nr:DUF4838 domain-containing protein [Paenibacillus sp. MBLB1832]WNR46845.1 DUF4838 domain-containing protein [Paenibacillus sp. MBLB1832]